MKEHTEVRQGTNQNRLSPIENLHTHLHHYSIFNYLSDKELYELSQTSNAMFTECRGPLLEKAGRKLLSHIVKAEEVLALSMIRVNPRLLLHTSGAIDYSKRPYMGYTSFQAALLCHDVTLWKKMEPYFDELPNGREEKAKQFNALFSEGIPKQTPYDFTALVQIITNSFATDIDAALKKTQNNTLICQALHQFKADFTTLSMREAFFNTSHLIKALQVYNEKFHNWSWHQRNLFWRQVIGYVQRFVPACYAQAFVQGLNYLIEKKRPLERALKFKYDSDSYFPLLDSGGLGFDFAIYSQRLPRSLTSSACMNATRELINYVEQIQQMVILTIRVIICLKQRIKCHKSCNISSEGSKCT